MNKEKGLFYASRVSWMAFVIAVSIAIPILCRPFYYAHIKPYQLETYSGYSEVQIREAYDDMLDYCLHGGEFKTGDMKWSENGKMHFDDVAKLFRIDFIVCGVGLAGVIATAVMKRKKEPYTVKGHTAEFYAGVYTLAFFILLGVLGAIDFSRFFVMFHKVFFPGKTNWIFSPREDEIINVLPEEYFRNCAIAIVVLLVGLCLALILTEKRRLKRLEG
ncbi:MAG: TIGR01906 family membrane protein [Erysipelotrichaceae bacterium]|nr:TIGR01906 family membrane protein [Erysipelotrichaceae bacterium]